jgi:hypothetical protein
MKLVTMNSGQAEVDSLEFLALRETLRLGDQIGDFADKRAD